MNKYNICEITQCLMDYMCTYPGCLINEKNESINCYECLHKNHKHDLPNFNHLIKLPLILQNSEEKIVCAISKLEFIQKSSENFPQQIKVVFKNLLTQVQQSFKNMENILLKRFKTTTDKMISAQNELNQMIDNFDENNQKQWKHRAGLAISINENILPNLSMFSVYFTDIKKFMQEMEKTITNLDQSTTKITEQIQFDQEIQLYKLDFQIQFIQYNTHQEYFQEEKCTNSEQLIEQQIQNL